MKPRDLVRKMNAREKIDSFRYKEGKLKGQSNLQSTLSSIFKNVVGIINDYRF
jgi:hypothetical protein